MQSVFFIPWYTLLMLSLKQATIRRDCQTILQDITWELKSHQHTAILGPNGAGKSTLIQALIDQAPLSSGKLTRDIPLSQIGYVSFQLATDLMYTEDRLQAARSFAGTTDSEITTAQDLILSNLSPKSKNNETIKPYNKVQPKTSQTFTKITNILNIQDLLHQPISTLSTGQFRLCLIARALIKQPQLLILDEPYDGLDKQNHAKFTQIIMQLAKSELTIILITHRIEDIDPIFQQIILLKKGAIITQGTPQQTLTNSNLSKLYDTPLQVITQNNHYHLHYSYPSISTIPAIAPISTLLVSFQNVTVQYQSRALNHARHPEKFAKVKHSETKQICSGPQTTSNHKTPKATPIIHNLTWQFLTNQHWAILGPNGSGKTTITRLIYADHPQLHSNDIQILGKRIGQGTSIWDIKQHISLVSPHLQLSYRKKDTAYDVIASGLFDSIGLYRQLTPNQHQQIQTIIDQLKLNHLTTQNFPTLSTGQQRLILIARALVKQPKLLILDELTSGLDIPNRARILNLINQLSTSTNLLFISHHHAEIPPCITHILQLPTQTTLTYTQFQNQVQ